METKRTRSRRSGKTGLSDMQAIIPKVVKELNLQSVFDEYNLQKHYKSLFGNELAKISYPDKIINKTLHVTVANSAWLMQISFMKADMIEKINKKFDRTVVENIIFKVGKLSHKKKNVKENHKVNLKEVVLADHVKKEIEENVKNIKDEELKKAIIGAETAYYKRKMKT